MDQLPDEQSNDQISVVHLSQTSSPIVVQEPTHTIIQIEPMMQNTYFAPIVTSTNSQMQPIQTIQVRYTS